MPPDTAPHPPRWIIHVDLDAFFASVEELLNPALRGKAVIVGGSPDRRGVVSSASYAARRRGVRSAMPMAQAIRLCPEGIVVQARHGEYGVHSQRVMDVLNQFTPVVEQISIDEAFLDVTGCEGMWGPVEEIGHMIQRRVLDECHLPVSLGIASSKLVAKIACDLGKPKGLILVPQGAEASFLAPLPIEKLWGVGPVTGGKLRSLGIQTIGDLATCSTAHVERHLGEWGRAMVLAANGLDDSPVHTDHERRSVSQEHTFAEDVADRQHLERTLLRMSESVASRLRHAQEVGQTVRLKLRFPDFTTITRQTRLRQPTDQTQMIYEQALALLSANLPAGRRVRLIGVGMSGLLEHGGYQLNLFDDHDQRRVRLNQALDGIRERYGRKAIMRASLLAPGEEVVLLDSTEKPGED
jgi:DNA polymerase IV